MALLRLGEACGPTWVAAQLCAVVSVHKNPKVLGEALVFFRAMLEAFSLPALSPDLLLVLAASALDSRDAAVREAAIKLLVELRRALGSALSLITLVGGALGYVLSDAAFKVLGCSSTSDFYCTSTVLLL